MYLYLEKITDPMLLKSYIFICLLSFFLSFLIVITAKFFIASRTIQDKYAVQSAHTVSVPRLGGLAIYLSVLGFILLLEVKVISTSFFPNLEVGNMYVLFLSAAPIFFVGLAEDLGYAMSPKKRLFASAVSGIIVIYLLQIWVSRLGIPGIDFALGIVPVAIVFTLFGTIGVINGFNLIDGLNGLASYVTISTAVALSVIAFQINSLEVLRFLFILSGCVLGFLLLNFPFGKIFLGDSGAYILGHLLVWSAIFLVDYNSAVSPFAILLIFFWPVADTLLSIWRRWRLKKRPDQPDRLHYHQLVMRYLEIRFLGRQRRAITNPLATVILVPAISAPQALGVLFWNNFSASVWATIIIGLSFLSSYLIGINLTKRSRTVNFSA